jgi:hypothetical protein
LRDNPDNAKNDLFEADWEFFYCRLYRAVASSKMPLAHMLKPISIMRGSDRNRDDVTQPYRRAVTIVDAEELGGMMMKRHYRVVRRGHVCRVGACGERAGRAGGVEKK